MLARYIIESNATVRAAAQKFGIARYIIESNATVRAAAQKFGISKSTVHKDVSQRLKTSNPPLYKSVRKVLDMNKSERHMRGGLATKEKYLRRKQALDSARKRGCS